MVKKKRGKPYTPKCERYKKRFAKVFASTQVILIANVFINANIKIFANTFAKCYNIGEIRYV